MSISAYHVDSVISAYNKQSKIKTRLDQSQLETKNGNPVDVVTISQKGIDEVQAYKKISDNIINVILKDKNL